jgi:hypothetical protein
MPKANELDLRKRLAPHEKEILKAIGEESKQKGTNTLTSRQIDRIIMKARVRNSKTRSRRASA